jgi:hypothetical protein
VHLWMDVRWAVCELSSGCAFEAALLCAESIQRHQSRPGVVLHHLRVFWRVSRGSTPAASRLSFQERTCILSMKYTCPGLFVFCTTGNTHSIHNSICCLAFMCFLLPYICMTPLLYSTVYLVYAWNTLNKSVCMDIDKNVEYMYSIVDGLAFRPPEKLLAIRCL